MPHPQPPIGVAELTGNQDDADLGSPFMNFGELRNGRMEPVGFPALVAMHSDLPGWTCDHTADPVAGRVGGPIGRNGHEQAPRGHRVCE
jgi:hypothetical protein